MLKIVGKIPLNRDNYKIAMLTELKCKLNRHVGIVKIPNQVVTDDSRLCYIERLWRPLIIVAICSFGFSQMLCGEMLRTVFWFHSVGLWGSSVCFWSWFSSIMLSQHRKGSLAVLRPSGHRPHCYWRRGRLQGSREFCFAPVYDVFVGNQGVFASNLITQVVTIGDYFVCHYTCITQGLVWDIYLSVYFSLCPSPSLSQIQITLLAGLFQEQHCQSSMQCNTTKTWSCEITVSIEFIIMIVK